MNTTTSLSRPLTTAIRDFKEASDLTLMEVAQRSGWVRAQGWFGDLLRASSPAKVNPPKESHTIRGIAKMLGRTEEDVCSMIAVEWYGVVRTELSHRGRVAAALVDQLSSQEWEAVQTVLQRMTKDAKLNSQGEGGSH